jgi:hypothetical protein
MRNVIFVSKKDNFFQGSQCFGYCPSPLVVWECLFLQINEAVEES